MRLNVKQICINTTRKVYVHLQLVLQSRSMRESLQMKGIPKNWIMDK